MKIKTISKAGGAIITGIDLSERQAPSIYRRIKNAFLKYSVIVMPAQQLDEEMQLNFCEAMGGVASRGKPLEKRSGDGDASYGGAVHLVTNLSKDGKPLGSFGDGEVWFHHDGSFKQIPYAATVLYGLSVTSTGGETVFANMYMAYDRLRKNLKNKIEKLKGLNIYDYASTGRVSLNKDISGINQWIHPLVIRHPDTGRKALYVSPLITARIEGLPTVESDTILEELFQFIKDEEIIFQHKWAAGDLVIMDNRCITHARKDFPAGETRMLRRTMVMGKKIYN